MRSTTLFRAYNKAKQRAMWGSIRTKELKMRHVRACRQWRKFEERLMDRMLLDDVRTGRIK